MPALPRRLDDLTPQWCADVLTQAGFPSSIAAVDLSAVGTGQMADSFRATLTYEAQAHRPDNAPDTLVIKMTSRDESSHAAGANGAYLKEVEWYRQLDATTTIATPELFFADIDPETAEFVLVLQDLHPAQQGDQVAGCTVDDAQRALLNVVGLHAPTWCETDLQAIEWLHPTNDAELRLAQTEQLFAHCTAGFLARYSDALDSLKRDLVTWFATRFPNWIRKEHAVFAATHGDYRLDNLLFESSPETGVWTVDWQTVRLDNPLADVAYLLGTGLNSDDRLRHEDELVRSYHAGLVQADVPGYSFADCFEDYRAQSLYSLVIIVLGSMLAKQTERGDEMFMTMLDRATSQISDLDARDTLA